MIYELQKFVQKAHEDAQCRLRNLELDSLDPLASNSVPDPAEGYPGQLHIQTLKGYFGEIFAGIIALHFSPFGKSDWEVPAFLFRFHLTEFQQLEFLQQIDEEAQVRPGRTGDDCLAFRRNSAGEIISSLVCEAKCTEDHDSGMIADAHEKASSANPIPVDRPQLIEILKERNDPDSNRWVEALRKLKLHGFASNHERFDLVSYVCGVPGRRGSVNRISSINSHIKYTARRRLEAVEVHLYDVEGLIEIVYNKQSTLLTICNPQVAETTWNKILAEISSSNTLKLLQDYCCLLHFEGEIAYIGVKSLSLFRDVQQKLSDIKDAFTSSGEYTPRVLKLGRQSKVKVKLKLLRSDITVPTDSIELHLSGVWKNVLSCLQLPIQALLEQQCCLLSLDGNDIDIGVYSQPLLRLVENQLNYIEDAFSKVLGHIVNIELIVLERSQRSHNGSAE